MTLWVETTTASPDELRANHARTLQKRVKQTLGISVLARVGQPGEVPRSTGKAVRIIDNRPKA